MKRRTRDLLRAGLCGVAIASGSIAARAETDSKNPPPVNAATLPSAPGGASCNAADTAERNRQREAALADLGKRLSAEQKADPDYQVLNRTGHNYGSAEPQQPN
jgi:type IV secretory pathway VirJ component